MKNKIPIEIKIIILLTISLIYFLTFDINKFDTADIIFIIYFFTSVINIYFIFVKHRSLNEIVINIFNLISAILFFFLSYFQFNHFQNKDKFIEI